MQKGVHAPASLTEEGFIHCSTHEQVLPTAALHFKDSQDLVVLEIPEKWVKKKLKWEPSRDEELFPHIYGSLPLHEVSNTHMIMRQKGEWSWV